MDFLKTWTQRLHDAGYVADDNVAALCHAAQRLNRPVLIEGPAGVGKTFLAKALALSLNKPLVRLQCYEGLDQSHALYDWNYPKQLLAARQNEATRDIQSLYDWDFLLERPLLKAILLRPAPVLLIDEVERAGEEFEAMLLEILGEYQITIPEIGTITADEPPWVVLTSNRTRDLTDALRRRCLYLWMDYPSPEQELAIIQRHVPSLPWDMAVAIVDAVSKLREWNLMKPPGVAESVDWARLLSEYEEGDIKDIFLRSTLSCVIKTREDLLVVERQGIRALWEN